jgi:DNA-binding IclR family transcriptional regulator
MIRTNGLESENYLPILTIPKLTLMNFGVQTDDYRPAPPAGSAIQRAFRVLDAVSSNPEGLSLAEISRVVGLPKPTVFRILGTLERDGLIVREPGHRRFLAGGRLAQLASAVLMGSPQRAARRAILDELVEHVGETCNLTVPNGHEVLYIDRSEADRSFLPGLRPGAALPLYAAASGKLFLSEMTDRARARFGRQVPRVPYTRQTLVDAEALERELKRIRSQGYATELDEYLPGRCCVAVGVRGDTRRLVAAVSIEARTERTPLSELIGFLPQLHAAAQALATTLEH